MRWLLCIPAASSCLRRDTFCPRRKYPKTRQGEEPPARLRAKGRPARAGCSPPWNPPKIAGEPDTLDLRSCPARKHGTHPAPAPLPLIRRGIVRPCAAGRRACLAPPTGILLYPPIRPFGAPSPHMGGRAFAGMRRENAPPRVFSNGTEKPPAAAQEAVGGRDLRLGLWNALDLEEHHAGHRRHGDHGPAGGQLQSRHQLAPPAGAGRGCPGMARGLCQEILLSSRPEGLRPLLLR